MRANLRKLIVCAVLVIIIACSRPLLAENVDAILDQSFAAMYNLQFDQALQKADLAKAQDKTNPMPWVAQASAILFRELERLHVLRSDVFVSDEAFSARPAYSWNADSKKQFEDALVGAEKLAQVRISRDKNDINGLFALTLLNGLRANDAALIGKHNLTSLSYTKTSTGYAEKLLAIAPGYYDAYIATGMGQYLIGSKPAPVRWVLRLGGFKGDQEQGLKELTLVSERGRYLAPFARILLAFNDLRHKNRTEARKKFTSLRDQFPGNPLFAQEMSKCDNSSASGGD